MNISCFIDESREIWIFFRWIDLNNEILKIKWVNKYMIYMWLKGLENNNKKNCMFLEYCVGWQIIIIIIICNYERQRVVVE